MKKILSWILSLIIALAPINVVKASENYNIQNINQYNIADDFEDFSNSNGINYYFYEDNNFVYSMSSNDMGIYCVINNKITNKIYEHQFINVSNKTVDDFKKILNKINIENFSENRIFENMNNSNISSLRLQENVNQISTRSSSIDKVSNFLANKYGNIYFNRYVSSKTSKGRTAKIYESKTFNVYNDEGWSLLAGVALTACSSIVGVPVTILKKIAISQIKDGVEVLVYGTKITKYSANVCYVKKAMIGQGIYAQSFKDFIGKAYVGNKDYVNYIYQRTRESGAAKYSDNEKLFQIAFSNY